MAGFSLVPVEFKHQGERGRLNPGPLNLHKVFVYLFAQIFRFEPVRNKREFDVSFIAVVCHAGKIFDIISIKRRCFADGRKTEIHRAGDFLRCSEIENSAVRFGQRRDMNIFQAEFYLVFVAHSSGSSLSVNS